MASSINADNGVSSGSAGLKSSADSSGVLALQTNGTTAVTIDASQNVTFAGAVSSSGNQTVTGNLTVNGNTILGDASTDTVLMNGAPSIGGAGLGMGMGFRNRIINGSMVIDQRNAGASVTPTNGSYTLDRFWYNATQASKATVQQSSIAPAGFVNSLLVTSSSAYSITTGDVFGVAQRIEGNNVADLGFGTASASTVTISFWVRSSLTGTFGGSLYNDVANRCYPFSYTISAANTWEQKSVTIAGDTSGTWLTTSGTGITLYFCLGTGSTYGGTANAWTGSTKLGVTGQTSLVGTNGATFYITGVQLEKGSTATAFDYRPYGTELALCQRYYQTFVEMIGQASGTTTMQLGIALQNEMRSTPSISATGACSFQDGVTAFTQSSFSYLNQGGSSKGINGYLGNFTGLTQFRMYQRNPTFGILTASAEL